jgi:DNA primase
MATYSPALLDDIRAGVDIVDLVGRFVNLRKAGANWKGLCPFHAEKTPSFTVNPTRGIFHCFGCGVGGDAFGFVMRQDRLSFPEAVRALATVAGVTLPEESERQPGDSTRDTLLRAMELAARFYAETLWGPGGLRARRYLEERAIDPEISRRFTLGLAPDAWDGLGSFMKSEHVDEEALVAAGLTIRRDDRSGSYDRFRGRLIFTIRDLQGRAVGFGGRAFGDEQPKYLNSPETPLYVKGSLLYAADAARESIRAKNRALIVEGYVDCLMAHQHGFTETVAALGTAFTPAQLHLLRRYTNEVVTFFDADAAGQKAAERAEALLDSMGTDAFWDPTSGGATWAINRSGTFRTSETLRVKVAMLPGGHDPDTFLRAEGAPAFGDRIASARSLIAYALEIMLGADVAAGPRARASVLARAALTIAKAADAEEAATVAREVAFRLGLDPVHLLDEARRVQAALRRPSGAAPPATRRGPAAAERDLVALLLHFPEARIALLGLLDERDVEHEATRALVTALKARPDAPAEALMADLADDTTRGLLASLLVDERAAGDPSTSIQQFRERLEVRARLRRMRETSRSIAETQAATGVETRLEDELRSLQEDGREVRWHALGGRITGPDGPQGVERHE